MDFRGTLSLSLYIYVSLSWIDGEEETKRSCSPYGGARWRWTKKFHSLQTAFVKAWCSWAGTKIAKVKDRVLLWIRCSSSLCTICALFCFELCAIARRGVDLVKRTASMVVFLYSVICCYGWSQNSPPSVLYSTIQKHCSTSVGVISQLHISKYSSSLPFSFAIS